MSESEGVRSSFSELRLIPQREPCRATVTDLRGFTVSNLTYYPQALSRPGVFIIIRPSTPVLNNKSPGLVPN